MQRQLTKNLRQYWDGKTSSKQDLKYRVAVNKSGIITDYEPINQVAYDHFRETPLPLCTKNFTVLMLQHLMKKNH
ncbi:MAG: hypothetical protein HC903_31115 [Methylacidiphilales bacterium]|nr:hypothetical protein [Candidatus Methylacidiphilales bacterium]